MDELATLDALTRCLPQQRRVKTQNGKRLTKYVMSFASLGWYRLPCMSIVKERFGQELSIFAGDSTPDAAIPLVGVHDLEQVRLHNRFHARQVLTQHIPWRQYLAADVLLLDLNPRMPYIWVLLCLRRLMMKRTVLWGHLWPRAGRYSKSSFVRSLMRRMASTVLTYTQSQARELVSIQPRAHVVAAPNALFSRRHFVFDTGQTRDSVIYVGRLQASKKPMLLLQAFEIVHRVQSHIRLVIVGDGEQLSDLRSQAECSSAHEQIEFHGYVDDYRVLRTLYGKAFVSSSPGYVGLSVTQSLSFGVPMVIARDEPHAPEIEAAVEGENSVFFESNDPIALANAILKVLHDATEWQRRGPDIARITADKYSVEIMAKGVIDALVGRG